MGGRLRRALAHRLPGAGRAALGLRAEGAAGHERRQPPAHHPPPRADAEGRERGRRRRRRERAVERAQGLPAARVLARIGRDGRDRPRDQGRHAARVADDLSDHGRGRRRGRRGLDRPTRRFASPSRSRCWRRSRASSASATARRSAPSSPTRNRPAATPSSRFAASTRPCRSSAARARRSGSTPGATAPVRFDATARATGNARVQMTVKLGANTDAFEMTLPVSAIARLETNAAFGDTDSRATEKLTLPPGIVPGLGGLQIETGVDRARRSGRRRAVPRRLSVRLRRTEGVERAGARARRRSGQRVRHGPHRAGRLPRASPGNC